MKSSTRLLLFLLLAGVSVAEARYIVRLRATVNALIDLNHDKSEYIDAGCRGRYQGTEEVLPSERCARDRACDPRNDTCAVGCP